MLQPTKGLVLKKKRESHWYQALLHVLIYCKVDGGIVKSNGALCPK